MTAKSHKEYFVNTKVTFPVFDIDTHYYEPRDAFTRHLEPKYLDLAVRTEVVDGREILLTGGKKHHFVPPTYDAVAAPGQLDKMLARANGKGSRDKDLIPVAAEFRDPAPRLALMDSLGIHWSLLFPSIAQTVEVALRNNTSPEVTLANFRAFNRYIEEDWSYNYADRLFAVAQLSLVDVDLAVEELDRVLAQGARVVGLMPGPVNGKSIGDPMFDPFWARVNEAQVPVAFHAGDSGYNQSLGVAWGHQPLPAVYHQSAWQQAFTFIDAPIMHTLGALVYDNVFGRFPNVKILSVENGANWVPYLLKRMDKAMIFTNSHTPWPGGKLTDDPSDIFKQHIFVNPYPEDDHASVIAALGVDNLVFGSDYPHPECLALPLTYPEFLPESSSDADVKAMMSDNAARLVSVGASASAG